LIITRHRERPLRILVKIREHDAARIFADQMDLGLKRGNPIKYLGCAFVIKGICRHTSFVPIANLIAILFHKNQFL